MKVAIVNFSNKEPRYFKGQMRQEESLRLVGYTGSYYTHRDFEAIGSPDHADVPYAFKAFAIFNALERYYDIIIWMDAAVYAAKPLDDFIYHITKNGYVFFDNIGFTVGDYTSDNCLDKFDITRAQAFNMPMIMACCFGLNVKHEKAFEFFERYYEAAQDGISFLGSGTNNNGQVSKDKRVKGHRHDQSVASIIINDLNLEILTGHQTFFTYFNHPGMMPVSESVCLFSHGL
jgi:hypothetical protein